ncbi:uracil-DNA glycosylase [Halobacillus salinarum]|uniref:Uracil-DNA glycosylase n=1 Tax=Halobacillus salinarum TaxID=2932257 RepID=A0ABY4EIX5_9BACI|nr:uracil-DNA glycosylase [Halobacillus salinarum]UOQ44436.1 uracil-DNA glycosylase [Halobacillus salinarum]
MDIPESIVQEAKERIQEYNVEGFVLGKGDPNAKVMIIGEAPGENEIVKDEPFIGRAGKELDKQLEYLEVSRNHVYITSVVRSRPYKWVKRKNKDKKENRKPNQKEILAHASLLDYQVQRISPSLIITLGGVAYERLTGRKDKMKDVLGKPYKGPILQYDKESDGLVQTRSSYLILPLYHPAAIFYNPRLKEDIYHSLDEVKPYLN